MIIGNNRDVVIENIRRAAETRDFYAQVEVDDPVLTSEQCKTILNRYIRIRNSFFYKSRCVVAGELVDFITSRVNKNTQVLGMENLVGLSGGAIVTSNHFSPLDNTVVRVFANKAGKKQLHIVGQESNLAMKGMVGFFMNYAHVIPISDDVTYMSRSFPVFIQELLEQRNFILIYPEQEMWFNYRKPRPPKRGAYYFAAKAGKPVVSCFVEMQDMPALDTPEFHEVRYTMHVLPVIYPDPAKSARENSFAMMERDYQQKKQAYEKAYGKPLTYDFQPEDIAGWIPPEQR